MSGLTVSQYGSILCKFNLKREARLPPDVRRKFETLPPETMAACLALRELAFAAAAEREEIGPLTETLKWGEPSYLAKTGSTLRIWRTRNDNKPALFVNCQTSLVERFRDIYPTSFEYRDNRAVVLTTAVADVEDALRHCMTLTFTYRLWK